MTRSFPRFPALVLLCLLVVSALASQGLCAEPPKAGGAVPPGLTLRGPLSSEDRAYLGIGAGESFKLSEVKGGFVLLEVVGVYCPQCHVQAPLFDKLFARLSQDPDLGGKVKMLGMAAGATKEEMEYLRESGVYKFPVASDPDYAAHKLLGEPKTPFTMLLDAKGKVLYAHLGIVEDVNALYEQIVALTR